MMRKGPVSGADFALDAAECISLQQILQAFNSTISEEHAWALAYQAARCFQKCLADGNTCYLVTEPRHVLLHKDGYVHPNTLVQPGDDSSREEVTSEQQLVVNLALAIYHALDYTHSKDEERLISPDLEGLITEMTACEAPDDEDELGILSEGSETSEGGRADTDDEGIERDADPAPRRRRRRRFMLRDVVERCVWHCGGGHRPRDTAAAHYRAVCRALVAEALELASFLARVRVGGARDLGAAEESVTHLDTLQFSDWSNRRIWRALQARFWVQVIGELRMGVKLKKVSYSRTPIEYELTPYEILMDDIRSRRYTLRKVDGAIPPSVKKDAHAMILEFIRSRPPLRKASERKLPPARREATPREKLLASIQVGRQLRPTPYSRRLSTSGSGSGPGGGEARRGDVTPHAPPQRRLIKVDFDNLEDDEDEEDTETCTSPEVCAPQPFPRHSAPQQAPKPWKRTEETPPRAPPRTRISHDEYHQFCDEALESYDLATQCPSRRASMRRHTVAHAHPVCPPIDGAHSLPHSRPGSRASCAGAASLASSDDAQLGELSWSRSSLQDELIKSKQWQDAIMSDDRLSLTLEEIVHIRSVLTKAELEVLPVEGRVKEDVEKRRVCFLCLKTRFGIFGPWGQKCKLCKKTVCQKCCSKMRIPTEHFAHVPVVLLSPSLLPSPEDEPSFPRSLMSRLVPEHSSCEQNSVGSAPSSPAAARRAGPAPAHSAPGSRGASALGFAELSVPPAMSRSVEGPESMPVTLPVHTPDRRARYSRSTTHATAAERLRGVQMAVCHDCKAMVLQIIKSSRASRSASRDRALRHLTLDLAPVYTADC
ncbi:protein spire isoform X2 [Cydia pomonella]|uniref:protein spire isoform X2 n=1 Tax=Cydia pomonella TaxID=82600 RepID=UPI002ADE8F02|nr:protein spire isoform X2 [Cydia pomonella]